MPEGLLGSWVAIRKEQRGCWHREGHSGTRDEVLEWRMVFGDWGQDRARSFVGTRLGSCEGGLMGPERPPGHCGGGDT